jgi:NADPH-dependent F420 reductase
MIGIIGGTGPEGRGLALRLAIAGEQVFIGSRNEERGRQIAEELGELAPQAARMINGGTNEDASARCATVLITTPYEGQKEILKSLQAELRGKIVINVVAPMVFNKGVASGIVVPEGSAALQSQAVLKESTIVAAFQNVSASDLLDPNKSVDCDVIVCANDDEARKNVMALAERIMGVRAINGGGLANAKYVEDLTALLVNINRNYKAHTSIRITGL